MSNKKFLYLLIIIVPLILAASLPALAQQESVTPEGLPEAAPVGGAPVLSPQESVNPEAIPGAGPTGATTQGIRDYVLAEPLPVPGGQPLTRITSFISYLQWLFPFLLSIAAILAFVMIVAGGVQYMTSAGSETAIGDAKKRITQAIFGLLLAVGSWLILYTINPDLVRFRLSLTGLNIPATSNEEISRQEIFRNRDRSISEARDNTILTFGGCDRYRAQILEAESGRRNCLRYEMSPAECGRNGGEYIARIAPNIATRNYPPSGRIGSGYCRYSLTNTTCINTPIQCSQSPIY